MGSCRCYVADLSLSTALPSSLFGRMVRAAQKMIGGPEPQRGRTSLAGPCEVRIDRLTAAWLITGHSRKIPRRGLYSGDPTGTPSPPDTR